MRGLVLAYYFILRRALRNRPDLRPYLTRCRHCRILFLTHPRNQGRKDLGCPFGCRDAHSQKSSTERSVEYYRTPAGRKKKAELNQRRRREANQGTEAVEETAKAEPGQGKRNVTEVAEFDAGIVEHVRVVVSLIERFDVSREDVVAMLARAVRQHRMVREKRLDYVLSWLTKHPP